MKGCVTWSTTPVRNYRDYKATDFGLAELSWLWGVNRSILTPPGLDEQWLVSLVTHRRRHGPPWSTTSASWRRRCAPERGERSERVACSPGCGFGTDN